MSRRRRAVLKLKRLDSECLGQAPLRRSYPRSKKYKRILLFDYYKKKRLKERKGKGSTSDITSPYEDHRLLREFQLTQISSTYVQCCNPECGRLTRCNFRADPTEIPAHWTCVDASAAEADELAAPVFRPERQEHMELLYAAGSLVWAKTRRHPWWPAMVDHCPDTEDCYWIDREESPTPDWYHVSFVYGGPKRDKVLRQWVPVRKIRPLRDAGGHLSMASSSKKHPSLAESVRKTEELEQMSLTERLRKQAFLKRYRGQWQKPDPSRGGPARKRRKADLSGASSESEGPDDDYEDESEAEESEVEQVESSESEDDDEVEAVLERLSSPQKESSKAKVKQSAERRKPESRVKSPVTKRSAQSGRRLSDPTLYRSVKVKFTRGGDEAEEKLYLQPPLSAKLLVILATQNMPGPTLTAPAVARFLLDVFPFFSTRQKLLYSLVEKVVGRCDAPVGKVSKKILLKASPSFARATADKAERCRLKASMRRPHLLDSLMEECCARDTKHFYNEPTLEFGKVLGLAAVLEAASSEKATITVPIDRIRQCVRSVFPFYSDLEFDNALRTLPAPPPIVLPRPDDDTVDSLLSMKEAATKRRLKFTHSPVVFEEIVTAVLNVTQSLDKIELTSEPGPEASSPSSQSQNPNTRTSNETNAVKRVDRKRPTLREILPRPPPPSKAPSAALTGPSMSDLLQGTDEEDEAAATSSSATTSTSTLNQDPLVSSTLDLPGCSSPPPLQKGVNVFLVQQPAVVLQPPQQQRHVVRQEKDPLLVGPTRIKFPAKKGTVAAKPNTATSQNYISCRRGTLENEERSNRAADVDHGYAMSEAGPEGAAAQQASRRPAVAQEPVVLFGLVAFLPKELPRFPVLSRRIRELTSELQRDYLRRDAKPFTWLSLFFDISLERQMSTAADESSSVGLLTKVVNVAIRPAYKYVLHSFLETLTPDKVKSFFPSDGAHEVDELLKAFSEFGRPTSGWQSYFPPPSSSSSETDSFRQPPIPPHLVIFLTYLVQKEHNCTETQMKLSDAGCLAKWLFPFYRDAAALETLLRLGLDCIGGAEIKATNSDPRSWIYSLADADEVAHLARELAVCAQVMETLSEEVWSSFCRYPNSVRSFLSVKRTLFGNIDGLSLPGLVGLLHFARETRGEESPKRNFTGMALEMARRFPTYAGTLRSSGDSSSTWHWAYLCGRVFDQDRPTAANRETPASVNVLFSREWIVAKMESLTLWRPLLRIQLADLLFELDKDKFPSLHEEMLPRSGPQDENQRKRMEVDRLASPDRLSLHGRVADKWREAATARRSPTAVEMKMQEYVKIMRRHLLPDTDSGEAVDRMKGFLFHSGPSSEGGRGKDGREGPSGLN